MQIHLLVQHMDSLEYLVYTALSFLARLLERFAGYSNLLLRQKTATAELDRLAVARGS